jgi:hypothetical protein
MGDVTDIGQYRNDIRNSIIKEFEEDDSLLKCQKCGDLLYMICLVPEHTDVDEGGPYAIICQHCNDAVGSAYLFDEDDEDEES